MRHAWQAIAIGVTAVIVGRSDIALAQASRPSESSLPPGLAAPERIGRYVRGASHDYGSAVLGVAYQYAPTQGADSTYATLYLYQREPEERWWTADSVIAVQVALFKEGLKVLQARGEYDNYELAFEGRDSATVRTGQVLPGYHVAYVYQHGASTAVSFMYVYVAGAALVKVRGTVPLTFWERTDLPIFAHDVAAQSVRQP
jgi:hypothetical protein